jgi:hypothetical protein
MASKYRNRALLDDDTTISDDPIAPGTPGIRTWGENVGQAIRVLETLFGPGSTLAPSAGTVLAGTGPGTSDWVPFPSQIFEVTWSFDTVTSPKTSTFVYRVRQPSTLLDIRTQLGTPAASGAACVVDLKRNGLSIIASGKPSITVGQDQNTNAQTFTSVALATGDKLTVTIDTGTDGAALDVFVTLQPTSPTGIPPVPQEVGWSAQDQGFVAWTFDPNVASSSGLLLVTGVIYIGAIPVRQAHTITNLWCHVTNVGSGLVASQSFMGLYSSAGTLLSATADMSGDFTSTGTKSKALTTPQAVVPGMYYVAVVSNGTTPPSLARGTQVSISLANAANLTAAAARWATNGTGTTLPSSLTMASNVTSNAANVWLGAS